MEGSESLAVVSKGIYIEKVPQMIQRPSISQEGFPQPLYTLRITGLEGTQKISS